MRPARHTGQQISDALVCGSLGEVLVRKAGVGGEVTTNESMVPTILKYIDSTFGCPGVETTARGFTATISLATVFLWGMPRTSPPQLSLAGKLMSFAGFAGQWISEALVCVCV